MPPSGRQRPDPETYAAVAGWLETELDAAWAANPYPGRINAIHRLNRTGYTNAIRDLLALDIDVSALLPGDETGSLSLMASTPKCGSPTPATGGSTRRWGRRTDGCRIPQQPLSASLLRAYVRSHLKRTYARPGAYSATLRTHPHVLSELPRPRFPSVHVTVAIHRDELRPVP